MSNGRKTILMIAGEASGDLLGAELIESIRRQPGGDEVDFIGAGGPRMEAASLRAEFDLSEHAVVGIWEVLKNYFKFRRLFRHLFELATRREPDAIVLIDYPGFNLRIAKWARPRGYDISYYISPQIWAWHTSRVHQVKANVDRKTLPDGAEVHKEEQPHTV